MNYCTCFGKCLVGLSVEAGEVAVAVKKVEVDVEAEVETMIAVKVALETIQRLKPSVSLKEDFCLQSIQTESVSRNKQNK